APIADPTTTNTTDVPLDPYSLTELVNTFPQDLTDYDQSFQMLFTIVGAGTQNITQSTVTLRNTTGGNTVDVFSDVQYKMPTTPTLFDAINGKTSFPAASNTFRVRNGTYVFMQIVNDDNTEHTFHLHGHTFWVTYHGRLLHAPVTHDTVAYPRRDAIQVPPCTGGTGGGGEAGCLKGLLNIVVYFDNPGASIFTGLMWTINNLDGVTRYASKVPTNLKNFCNTPPDGYMNLDNVAKWPSRGFQRIYLPNQIVMQIPTTRDLVVLALRRAYLLILSLLFFSSSYCNIVHAQVSDGTTLALNLTTHSNASTHEITTAVSATASSTEAVINNTVISTVEPVATVTQYALVRTIPSTTVTQFALVRTIPSVTTETESVKATTTESTEAPLLQEAGIARSTDVKTASSEVVSSTSVISSSEKHTVSEALIEQVTSSETAVLPHATESTVEGAHVETATGSTIADVSLIDQSDLTLRAFAGISSASATAAPILPTTSTTTTIAPSSTAVSIVQCGPAIVDDYGTLVFSSANLAATSGNFPNVSISYQVTKSADGTIPVTFTQADIQAGTVTFVPTVGLSVLGSIKGTSVALVVSDPEGNSATCSFAITIKYAYAPAIDTAATRIISTVQYQPVVIDQTVMNIIEQHGLSTWYMNWTSVDPTMNKGGQGRIEYYTTANGWIPLPFTQPFSH
ncbi:hypothetical protein HDU76_008041, partial [Blyttiomyces sp. JEL0837]